MYSFKSIEMSFLLVLCVFAIFFCLFCCVAYKRRVDRTKAITDALTEAITEAITDAITEDNRGAINAITEDNGRLIEAITDAINEAVYKARTEYDRDPSHAFLVFISEVISQAISEAITEAITAAIIEDNWRHNRGLSDVQIEAITAAIIATLINTIHEAIIEEGINRGDDPPHYRHHNWPNWRTTSLIALASAGG